MGARIDLSLYPIDGILVSAGVTPLRREVASWSTSYPIQLSLFIRALQKFYTTPIHVNQINASSPPSYFQVGGIHGQPMGYCNHNVITFPTWHRPYMLLFEKRIYDLMGQVIDDLDFPLAGEKQQWIQQQSQWRLPYFDWAVPHKALPDILAQASIAIKTPKSATGSSQPDTVITPNPLAGYLLRSGSNKPLSMGDPSLGDYLIHDAQLRDSNRTIWPWGHCSGTSRWAITSTDNKAFQNLAGFNNVDGVNANLQRNIQIWNKQNQLLHTSSVGDLVYRLLSPNYSQTYREFSSTISSDQNAPQTWTGYLSLEMIHNNIHMMIGGSDQKRGLGQMMDPSVAAFDPIFYMHHCNVDRQFAIWQTFNDDWHSDQTKWFQPYTYIRPSDRKAFPDPSATDSLWPFYRTANGHVVPWTSNDTHTWTTYGYQYDTIQVNPDKQSLAAALGIYNGTAATITAAPDAVLTAPATEAPSAMMKSQAGHMKPVPQVLETTAPEPAEVSSGMASSDESLVILNDAAGTENEVPDPSTGLEEVHNDIYPDYIVNIIYDRYALGGAPYTIHFFLGDVTDQEISSSTTSLFDHPRHVGSVYTFSRVYTDGETVRCPNCAHQADYEALSTGQVPLTITLVKHAEDQSNHDINHIDHRSVDRYLTRHLTWKVLSQSGDVINLHDMPRLRVLMLKGKAHHHREPGQMSRYFDYSPMSNVTHGKVRGASHHHYAAPHHDL